MSQTEIISDTSSNNNNNEDINKLYEELQREKSEKLKEYRSMGFR